MQKTFAAPALLFQDHFLRSRLYAVAQKLPRDQYWILNFGGFALMWRGGCIIRSRFLGTIKVAYDRNPDLRNLLLHKFFTKVLTRYQAAWRRAVTNAVRRAVCRTPALGTALAFYDGYRTGRLPANLLQAQRDFFGAHTYERVDKPRGKFFHTANWTGKRRQSGFRPI